jgi:hypothetical protein
VVFAGETDIFKTLALGAGADRIGRPYWWGLAAFGQEGVEAVLELMRSEFELVMKGMGGPGTCNSSRRNTYARRRLDESRVLLGAALASGRFRAPRSTRSSLWRSLMSKDF